MTPFSSCPCTMFHVSPVTDFLLFYHLFVCCLLFVWWRTSVEIKFIELKWDKLVVDNNIGTENRVRGKENWWTIGPLNREANEPLDRGTVGPLNRWDPFPPVPALCTLILPLLIFFSLIACLFVVCCLLFVVCLMTHFSGDQIQWPEVR